MDLKDYHWASQKYGYVMRVSKGEGLELHSHDYPHIIIPLRGNLTVEVNKTQYQIGQGEAVFVQAKTQHGFTANQSNQHVKYLVLYAVSGNFLQIYKTTVFRSDPIINTLIEEMAGGGRELAVIDPAEALITKILELRLSQPTSTNKLENLTSSTWLIKNMDDERLVRAVESAFNTSLVDWNIDSFAKSAAMSTRNFSRLFKAKTQHSVGRWIFINKMAKAAQLLKETGLGTEEIAYEVGYRSYSQFSQSFFEHFQLRPSSYRLNYKK